MLEPAIQKAFRAETIFTPDEIHRRRSELWEKNQRDRIAQINYAVEQAITAEREKYFQEEEKRVVNWIKKGKSLDDIIDFTSLAPERVKQLWAENRS